MPPPAVAMPSETKLITRDIGETGAIVHQIPLKTAMIIAGLFAVAIYNSLEIYISIFRTFRRRRGLYFWSMVAANTGIPILSVFNLLRYFNIAHPGPTSIIVDIGWWLMVTGQACMLYSRLHLVIGNPRKLRWVLFMVVGMFLFFQVPTATLYAVISFKGRTKTRVTGAFDVIEMVQLVAFAIEESILSGLYVYASRRTLKPMMIIRGPKVRALLNELVGLFVLVVVLDISLIVVQFANLFYIQTTYKPLVYSIKLKVEAYVLNNLVTLVVNTACTCQHGTKFQSNRPVLTTTREGSWRSRRNPSTGVAGGLARPSIPTITGAIPLPTTPTPTDDGSTVQPPVKAMSF
ncbi:hypothetical protein F5Y10DRAFT_284081 [Nemania abortiva]|nr:hypothetical protein F5Y10DRAFT_284081 [Nemania abortiva]